MTASKTYAYLGPEGTFTEAALLRLPDAVTAHRVPCHSALNGLSMIRSGEVDAAMLPIENSVEGGVSATLDAIAAGDSLRILREEIIPVSFVYAVKQGTAPEDVRIVSTHPHAWAQVRTWADQNIPNMEYSPSTSTAAAAHALAAGTAGFQAAICAPHLAEQLGLTVVARNIEDTQHAVTRFILVAKPGSLPQPTGADKTTVAVPLSGDRPGALMDILDQFASRGINLSRIESRPTGEHLGRYIFSIDADGHILEERVADALRGLYRVNPGVKFLGSYPRADQHPGSTLPHTTDETFQAAHNWVAKLLITE